MKAVTRKIILAAKRIDAEYDEFSCYALLTTTAYDCDLFWEYERIFMPYPHASSSFAGQLGRLVRNKDIKQWRVLALCFYAAMKEQE